MSSQRSVRLLFVFLAACLMFAAIASIAIYRLASAPGEDLRRELAAIKAAGEPVALKDALPAPIPDSENAAVVYGEAFAVLNKGTPDEQEAFYDLTSFNPVKVAKANRKLIRRLVARNRHALDLARKAALMPRCRFHVDWSDPMNAKFPHYSKLRHCMRLLVCEALLEKEHGDVEDATQICVVLLRMVKQLDTEEPSNILTHLAKLAFYSLSLRALEQTLASSDVRQSTYHRLLKELKGIDVRVSQTRALVGERWINRAAFHFLDRESRQTRPRTPSSFGRFYAGTILPHDEVLYLRRMTSAIELSKVPDYNWDRVRGLDAWEHERKPLLCIISAIITPTFESLFKKTAGREASVQLARIAIALRLSRLAHGAYPATLKSLAPAYLPTLPIDPFSGKDYIYHRKDKGFVVYSVGVNQKDDGGMKCKHWEEGDIVWTSLR